MSYGFLFQACIPLSYTDPYYNGLLAAYGAQAMVSTSDAILITFSYCILDF